MKTKEELKKLFEKLNVEDETLLAIHVDNDDNISGFVAGSVSSLAAAIATVVNDGYSEDCNRDDARLAKAIIRGVGAVMSIPSIQSIKVSKELLGSLKEATSRDDKGIFSVADAVKDIVEAAMHPHDDDDDDDDEDCEHCGNVKNCPLPSAIKYRKEHPARFKRNRNGGKKGKKNDKGN